MSEISCLAFFSLSASNMLNVSVSFLFSIESVSISNCAVVLAAVRPWLLFFASDNSLVTSNKCAFNPAIESASRLLAVFILSISLFIAAFIVITPSICFLVATSSSYSFLLCPLAADRSCSDWRFSSMATRNRDSRSAMVRFDSINCFMSRSVCTVKSDKDVSATARAAVCCSSRVAASCSKRASCDVVIFNPSISL